MSFFSKIFGKKTAEENSSAVFVNPIHVEFHSHLIFGVDDGCEFIDQSIDLLKGFANLGMTKVITTPHVMSDFYKNSKENVYPLRDQIRKRLVEENIPIQFEAAAEYMIDDGFEKKILDGDMLTFGPEGKHILIELPFMTEPPNLSSCLFELQIAGYKPILAHPERYLYYANDKDKYHELKDRGILFQLNLLSGLGYYSKPVADAANYLVQKELIDLVGSDTHHIKHMQLLPEALQSKTFKKVCEAELLNNYL
ncbi:MAG: capsular biosynthesis protein [Bacteroidia bacterium]|nr:capsular biosynthesis protein [Bacteroidia bacterium]MCF8426934.1 capsular biosynthesis protein [Bacteroidia bacterium]MCF8446824.1 capsular biosynthesis protein [Bacteroidia bacterium]